MRFDKFTIKSQELIQNSQTLTSQYHHQQMEPEHLLAAMLKEPDGIAGAMLRKLGASPDEIAQQVVAALESALELEQDSIDSERDILRDFGNMSAPTALFVLDRVIKSGRTGRMMLCALGPGFTASFMPLHVGRSLD